MATQTGKINNFGLSQITIKDQAGTAITGLGATNIIMTSAKVQPKSEVMKMKNESGVTVNKTIVDPSYEATIELIPVGTSAAESIAAQEALFGLKDHIIQISGSTTKTSLNKTTWYVLDVDESGSNTEWSKVTLTLESHASITANPS